MAVKFIEAGGGATGGLEFWSAITGSTVSADTGTKRPGHAYSLKVLPADTTPAYFYGASGVAENTGRLSFYFLASAFASANVETIAAVSVPALVAFSLFVKTTGVLGLSNSYGYGTQIGSDGPTLSTGNWYRICLAWSITDATTFTIKLYVDSVLGITANSGTLAISGSGRVTLGLYETVPTGTRATVYYSDIYIDNDSSLNDCGNINVTAKKPAALNTNNFDTLGGSGANRYDRVSERPISVTNYIAHVGATDVQENFGLQTESAGDADTTGATYIARQAWVYAKRTAVIGTGTPKATGSGAANSTGTTVAATLDVAVVVGDLVVVALADQMGGAAPTIADTGTNSWTALSGPTTNTVRCNKWYTIVTTGGTLTITATFGSANSSRAIVAAAWDKDVIASSSQLDTNVTNANDSTSTYDTPLSGTLAQADEIVLGFAFAAGNAAFAAGTNTTISKAVASSGGGAAGNASVAIGHRVVAATTSVQCQFTLGTNRVGVVGTCSFKLGTVKVAGTPKIMDNGSESAITLTAAAALYKAAISEA